MAFLAHSQPLKALFGFQDALEVVTNVVQLPANPTKAHRTAIKDSKKKDCKAAFFIHQSIDAGNLDKIFSCH